MNAYAERKAHVGSAGERLHDNLFGWIPKNRLAMMLVMRPLVTLLWGHAHLSLNKKLILAERWQLSGSR